jgi:hypothetical protein
MIITSRTNHKTRHVNTRENAVHWNSVLIQNTIVSSIGTHMNIYNPKRTCSVLRCLSPKKKTPAETLVKRRALDRWRSIFLSRTHTYAHEHTHAHAHAQKHAHTCAHALSHPGSPASDDSSEFAAAPGTQGATPHGGSLKFGFFCVCVSMCVCVSRGRAYIEA